MTKLTPKHHIKTDRYNEYKTLDPEMKEKIEQEIKAMLHAHRDTLRNQSGIPRLGERKGDPEYHLKAPYDVGEGFYGEAFGMLRSLSILGYGYFGADNVGYQWGDPDINLKFWFDRLTSEVLEEEGWDGDHRCDFCYDKYKKDDLLLIEKRRDYNEV